MGILETIDVGETGLYTHGKRLEIHARNIANVDTPNYVRKIPVLMANEDISFNGMLNRMKEDVLKSGTLPTTTGGVALVGVQEDPALGEKVYAPGHPDADREGYIRKSNVNPLVDMADATMTTRAYEASLAVVSLARTMAQRASEIGK